VSFAMRLVCDHETLSWSEHPCDGDTPVCDRDACRACASGRSRCDGVSSRWFCVDGNWEGTAHACSSLRPHCEDGQCVPSLKIAAGGAHACAALPDFKLKCWGKGANGQLGDGYAPKVGLGRAVATVDLGQNRLVRAVAAGGAHTCALLDGGDVKCWGDNFWGQLGQGDRRSRGSQPGELGDALPSIALGGAASAVAAGQSHSCALLTDGRVKCWGANTSGQLGVGDTNARGDDDGEMGENLSPVEFGSGLGATVLGVGAQHNCAAVTDGGVKCWGANADGDEDRADDMLSVTLDRAFAVSALALGARHACALATDGRVACWGANAAGQLGVTSPESTTTPELLDFGHSQRAIAITAGANHSCAVLDGGELHCWGYNDRGQLGVGTLITMGPRWLSAAASPPIFGASAQGEVPIVDVSGGGSFTCALLETGSVKCWGDNTFGQLGAAGEAGDDIPPLDLGL